MIIVNAPWNNRGEFLSSYNGENRKIISSLFKLHSQIIDFNKELRINGNVVEKCCFELALLNRKYLIVFEQERLYEIIQEGEDKLYILLTTSYFYMTSRFLNNNRFIIQGKLTLNFDYSEDAQYSEEFDYQLNLRNNLTVKMMFENINE